MRRAAGGGATRGVQRSTEQLGQRGRTTDQECAHVIEGEAKPGRRARCRADVVRIDVGGVPGVAVRGGVGPADHIAGGADADALRRARAGSRASVCELVVPDQPWTPLAGSRDVTMRRPPADTQSETDGQDTVSSEDVPLTSASVHAAAPPVGSAALSALPALSTATQRLTDGHDTSRNAACDPVDVTSGSIWLTVHASGPPGGSVEVTALPAVSTATHSDADGLRIELELDCPHRSLSWSNSIHAREFATKGRSHLRRRRRRRSWTHRTCGRVWSESGCSLAHHGPRR